MKAQTIRSAWSVRPGSNIAKVDPRLVDIQRSAALAFAVANPGYTVEGISGKKGRKSGTVQHPRGWAVDVSIRDPKGNILDNYQNAKTFRAYEKYAQEARAYQQKAYPELNRDFRWGGYFSGKNKFDLMHFDINPLMRGVTAMGNWLTGLTKAGRRSLPGAWSVGMAGAFPQAPAGPTIKESGVGPWGARSPADIAQAANLAQNYAAAGNRRSREQGYRAAPTGVKVGGLGVPASTTPAAGYAQLANSMAEAGVPHVGLSSAMAAARMAAPDVAGRVGIAEKQDRPAAMTPNAAAARTVAGMISGANMPVGPSAPIQRAAMPPTPTARPQASWQATAQAVRQATAPATPQAAAAPAPAPQAAYPDEGRFSMKPGMTPADMAQIGLTPAPAFTKPPTEVAAKPVAPAAQTVANPQAAVSPEQTTSVASPATAETLGAPVLGTGLAGFPAAPTQQQIARAKMQGLFEHPLATLGNPLKGLGALFGPAPTPQKTTYGTGLKAIGDVLSGNVPAGATAYSRSTPGFSVTHLGGGIIQKTNPYGVVSYENVGSPMKSSFGGGSFGGWGGGKSGGSYSGGGGKGYGGSGSMSAGSGGLSHSTRY